MTRQFKIGDFLKRIKNQIDINDSVKYKRVTVSGNHNGVSLRDEVLGSAIGTKKQFTIKRGNFILSKIDARNGAFGIIPAELDNAIITGNFWTYSVDTKLIDIEWFFYFTHSYNFIQICIESSTGSTHRKYMDEKVFLNHKIILPEIVEQKEMVKKYKNSSKISNNLTSEIQTQKQLLTQLKQSILQEAIQGKLTADWRKQNPNAEPASELLNRIKAEKAQLIKDKKIKKEKALPPITAEEIPFELPEGWVWCRLGDISTYLNGKGFNSTDFKKNIGVKCIKITNAGVGEIIETDDTLPIEFENEYSAYLVYENDIVIALTRPYIADGLKVSLCPESYNKSLLNQRVAVVRASSNVQNKYIYKYLKTKFVLDGYKREFDSTGQQPNLKTEHVTNLIFPLAPVEEQKAIVEKVEILMQKCQALEQKIKTSEANAQMLMQAVLKEAFEGKQEVVEV